MYNRWVDTEMKQLSSRLLGGTWHLTYKEHLYARQNIPTEAQIQAATMQDARTFLSTTAEGEGFCATAEEVHATRTKEEEMVQELLNGWQKGAHGYIPDVKDNNVIQLGCENVNSLSTFHPTKSKMCKLTHLHQRHQTDGACIVEHDINFKMAAAGTHPEDLFPGICSSRVSAGHSIHELHNRYQQSKTIMVAFSRLATWSLVLDSSRNR
jgi:hypothetical protein